MSWETRLFTSIEFNRATYNDKYDVESDLDETNGLIETCEKTIRDLVVMTEPNKFFNSEDSNPYLEMTNEYEHQIDFLKELLIKKYKLCILLDEWDNCHDIKGLAINPPDSIEYDTAYLDGDFINTVSNPNKNKTL